MRKTIIGIAVFFLFHTSIIGQKDSIKYHLVSLRFLIEKIENPKLLYLAETVPMNLEPLISDAPKVKSVERNKKHIAEMLEEKELQVIKEGWFNPKTLITLEWIGANSALIGEIINQNGYVEIYARVVDIRTMDKIALPLEHLILTEKEALDPKYLNKRLKEFGLILKKKLEGISYAPSSSEYQFKTNKVGILVANFIDETGNVSAEGKKTALIIEDELERMYQKYPELREIIEVKKLPSNENIPIPNHERALDIGSYLNADIVIWGKLCSLTEDTGETFYCSYVSIQHDGSYSAQTTSGKQYSTIPSLLKTGMPALVGASSEQLIKFIVGWTYLNDNQHEQYKKAVVFLQEAYNQKGASDDNRYIIEKTLCEAFLKQGNLKAALKLIEQLRESTETSKKPSQLNWCQNYLGSIYLELGQLDKSLIYFEKSLQVAIELKDSIDIAINYNNLSAVYLEKRKFDLASQYLKKSLKIFEIAQKNDKLIYIYNNLGWLRNEKKITYNNCVPLLVNLQGL